MSIIQPRPSIQHIPEGSSVNLSKEVIYYLLMQVPYGRLTRRDDMTAFLAKLFRVHHVEIVATHLHRCMDPNYITKIIDFVPRHREIGTRGHLQGDPNSNRLAKEGHEIVPYKRKGYAPVIKNYKKYLFDFSTEANIRIEDLEKINREGLSDYFPSSSKA